ncbi:uncharacterized protein LOC134211218 [Armigeres subalbatus]|uniref:uncharacterized protein LOC134211218 n=1 Tax=Armigeres subalbatus TaxID=124917 RepID=UPI002ED0B7C3
MPCEGCNVQFGIITRKKSCFECRRLFCKNCLEKRQEKILCPNCLIFTKRPLSKVDLGQLKNKDLILYLQSKHISTTGCVEKDDLINLVIAHVNSAANSPRSPAGSTGSAGNGRMFNFSSPSSTGGSSGNGRGGSQSGSSSRNFYASSAENCANTFDQIKNTCQNLFSSISDKLSTDIPRTTNFGPRFSNSSTEENLRPRAQPEGSVHQQPRFGNNDVYWVHEQQAAQSANRSSQASQPVGGAVGVVPNEKTFSTLNDFSGSSGTTSGADSSANTSSVSSPAHTDSISGVKPKLSLSERIDNMLASEENQNDCECSDDEADELDAPRRKECKKAGSNDNILSGAGSSQPVIVTQLRIPESKTDTSSSSFDELNPECDQNESLPEVETSALTDTEPWQLINNPDCSDTQEASAPTLPTTTTATMTETTDSSSDLNSSDKIIQTPASSDPVPNQVARRRSDSFLMMVPHGDSIVTARSMDPEEIITQSSQSTSTNTNKCFKCGKRRSGIRKQLKKIRKLLDTASVSEADKRCQLEAFLSYLERRSKGSIELSEGESMSEDASISLAEGDTGIAAGFAMPSVDPNDQSRQQTLNYPRVDADDTAEKTNVYSSGNQQLASMSLIQLSDIKESADLDVLSVKQLKKILVLNRVDFKGCCEKAELRERVLRLWFDYKSIASPERLAADDLCRICMDAPINCVILECGHMATCINCGKVLSECPICRQYIVRVVRSFKV